MNKNAWVCRSALLTALALGLIPAISLGYNIGKSEHPLGTQQYAPLQDNRNQLDQQRQQQLERQRQQQLRQQQEWQRQQQLQQQQEWQRQQQIQQQQEWQRVETQNGTEQHPPRNDPQPPGGFARPSSKPGELVVTVVVGLVVLAVVIRFWRLLFRLAVVGVVILVILFVTGLLK